MEREVGGGIGMGNTCKPMAVSFQCMTKSTTNKKKKKKKVVCIIYWDYCIMDSTSFFSSIILFNSHDLIEYIVLFLSILSSSYSLIFQLQKLIIKRSSDFLLVPN